MNKWLITVLVVQCIHGYLLLLLSFFFLIDFITIRLPAAGELFLLIWKFRLLLEELLDPVTPRGISRAVLGALSPGVPHSEPSSESQDCSATEVWGLWLIKPSTALRSAPLRKPRFTACSYPWRKLPFPAFSFTTAATLPAFSLFLLHCFSPSHPLLHGSSAPASMDAHCAAAAITNHLWSPRFGSELESVKYFSLSKRWGWALAHSRRFER